MAQTPQPLSFIVRFGVRNTKDRGILIESLAARCDEYFFKFHDQPLNRHCVQVQNAIRAANVKGAKKITIDIAAFSFEYIKNNIFTFKGTALNSVSKQIVQVCDRSLNKHIGAMKRRNTIAANKQIKIAKQNEQITANMEEAEVVFQIERAKRIHKMFGGIASHSSQGPQDPQVAGEQSGNDDPMNHGLPRNDDDL